MTVDEEMMERMDVSSTRYVTSTTSVVTSIVIFTCRRMNPIECVWKRVPGRQGDCEVKRG
jgi:hypothetical protein